VPGIINGFIDGSVNLFIRDITDLLCAPVQELFEFSATAARFPEGWTCCGGTAATLTSSSASMGRPKSCSTADFTPRGRSLAFWIETFCMQ
jgi:hypothetical protein